MYVDPDGHAAEAVDGAGHKKPMPKPTPKVTPILKKGSTGEDVKRVQKELRQKGYSIVVDGKYGPKTEAAVRDYQKKNGLASDGIVGNKTGSSLNNSNGHKNDNHKTAVKEVNPVKNTNEVNHNAGNSKATNKGTSKTEDVTRALAEKLIANPAFVYAAQQGWFKELFYAAGFVIDDDGVFHARQEWSLQSFKYSGYNNFYDTVFHYATSMEKDIFKFSYNNKEYVLWAWKGDYLNLGAGAEMGIYTKMVGVPFDHWLVDESLAMPMALTLDYKGKQIISYDPKKVDPQIFDPLRKSTDKWWLTGFNPDYQDVKASELTPTYTVNFSKNKDMFTAFYKTWYGVEDAYGNKWKFNTKNYTASLTFKGGLDSK